MSENQNGIETRENRSGGTHCIFGGGNPGGAPPPGEDGRRPRPPGGAQHLVSTTSGEWLPRVVYGHVQRPHCGQGARVGELVGLWPGKAELVGYGQAKQS